MIKLHVATMRDIQNQMQNRAYASQNTSSKNSQPRVPSSTATAAQAASQASSQRDELTRIFNTALVSTQVGEKRDFSAELYELTESASFKTILNAVRQLARVQCVSERIAAEQVIQAFRKMDEIWGEYIFREGLDRLRSPRN